MHDGSKERVEELLYNAIRISDAAMAQKAIDLGADVNAKNKFEESALHHAARNGQLELTKLFIENGADMNATTDRNETPLQLATHYGHFDTAKLLVEKGADVNVKAAGGRTPLHSAARGGNVDIVRLLIDAGADINAKDQLEQTPLDLAAPYVPDIASLLKSDAAKQQHGHDGRISEESKLNEATPRSNGFPKRIQVLVEQAAFARRRLDEYYDHANVNADGTGRILTRAADESKQVLWDAVVQHNKLSPASPIDLEDALAAVVSTAAAKQQDHAGRVTEDRKGKGPPQVGG